MPLNEASAPPSNLTRRERHEALAAIYSVPGELTEFDAEQLRQQLSEDENPDPDQ